MNKTILVIGRNSQLGQSLKKTIKGLQKILYNTNYQSIQNLDHLEDKEIFFFVSRKELDLSNPKLIKDFFDKKKFKGIINCAAYTISDYKKYKKYKKTIYIVGILIN